MNAVSAFPRFLVVSSVILIIAGVSQVFVRPRRDNETIVEKLVNRATITAQKLASRMNSPASVQRLASWRAESSA